MKGINRSVKIYKKSFLWLIVNIKPTLLKSIISVIIGIIISIVYYSDLTKPRAYCISQNCINYAFSTILIYTFGITIVSIIIIYTIWSLIEKKK